MTMTADDDSLLSAQKELESINLAEAAERFWKRMEGRLDGTEKGVGIESRKTQMTSMTPVGANFIREKVGCIVKRIEMEFEKIQAGRGGRGNDNIISLFCAHSLEAIVYLALKEVVDRGCRNIRAQSPTLFRYDLIINAIGRNVALELEARRQKDGVDSLPAVVILDKAIRCERNSEKGKKIKRQKRNLIARLAEVDFSDDLQKGRIGQVLYKMMLDEGILIEGSRDRKRKTVQLADEVLALLANKFDESAQQKPLFGPLVVPPRSWTKNSNGGYHFDLKGRHTLLKTADKSFCEANVPAVFAAVNTLQSTAFHINHAVFEAASVIISACQNDETFDKLFGIPQALPISIRRWLLVAVKRILTDASRVKGYSKIYFTCFLDFRGRYYCKTTHLNPQGTDLCRGLIEFANAKPINNEKSVRWLINHGVSCYGNGFDRGTFSDREKWARDSDNMQKIRSLAQAPISAENRTFLESADKPWEFLAWCLDWVGFCDKGFGYESRLPVAVDGSCNGIQHFAALTRSRDLAEQVNLANMSYPSDIYHTVAERTEKKLHERHNAMTWYSSLTLEEVAEKYSDYSLQLSQLQKDRLSENQEKLIKKYQVETEITEEAIDESAERLADDDFNDVEVKSAEKEHEEKMLGEVKDMEFVRSNKWTALTRNKKIECLQECRRQLAECLLFIDIPESSSKINFSRKLVKSIVMTFPYSATHNGNVKGMIEQLNTRMYMPYLNYLKNSEIHIHQPDHMLSHAIVRNTRAVIRETAKSAILIMDYLKSLLPDDAMKPEVSWISPTGLKICQYYAIQDVTNKVTLEYSDMRITLQKLGKGKKADLHKHKQGISPNFVHSCDAAHMMKTVNAAKRAGIDSFLMIHDSYATHAADMDTLSRILREEFVNMYDEKNPNHPLETLRQALLPMHKQGSKKKTKKKIELIIGDFDINNVLESDYFFS